MKRYMYRTSGSRVREWSVELVESVGSELETSYVTTKSRRSS